MIHIWGCKGFDGVDERVGKQAEWAAWHSLINAELKTAKNIVSEAACADEVALAARRGVETTDEDEGVAYIPTFAALPVAAAVC